MPADEVLRIDLKDETLQVDGNFALMRTGPNRVLGREIHQEPARHADQRRGIAPDVPGDRLGLAGPDPGDLPAVAGGRDGQLASRLSIIGYNNLNTL